MNFNSLSALEKYLTKVITEGMEDVGTAVEHKVREKIDEEIYHNPTTPKVYERTYELKNSLVHTHPTQSGGAISTEIKHDTNLMGSYEPNQHMSVVTGEPYIAELPEKINKGLVGRIFGEGYWTEPRPYFEDAKVEVEYDKLHVKALKDSLRSKGIIVEG